jgi:hypothetical protein
MPLDALDLGSGGGAAPGSFRVLGQVPAIQVYAGTKVRDAVQITVQELTYGVTFSFTIPRTEWAGEGTQGAAELYAGWVQYIGARDHVVGLSYTEDVNASGNLTDMLLVTLATPDGNNVAEVEVELAQANTEATFGKLDAAYQTLVATAALT